MLEVTDLVGNSLRGKGKAASVFNQKISMRELKPLYTLQQGGQEPTVVQFRRDSSSSSCGERSESNEQIRSWKILSKQMMVETNYGTRL
jgi:hypothetical protein